MFCLMSDRPFDHWTLIMKHGARTRCTLISFRIRTLHFLFKYAHFNLLPTSNMLTVHFDPQHQNLMFNLCIYPLERIQETVEFFLLRCLRLLIALFNGS